MNTMNGFLKGLLLAFVFVAVPFGVRPALAQTYSVDVTTPSGANDIHVNTFTPYTAKATLRCTGNLGELKIVNERWSWTNSNSNWGYQSNQYQWVLASISSKFLTTDTPPADSSKSDPTTVQISTAFGGNYLITLTATDTFDLQNPDGTTASTNITATGSASGQIQVDVPDFTLSDGDNLTIKIEDSGKTTVTATAINGFTGNISLSLSPSAAHNPGDPGSAPTGVSADSATIVLPTPGSTSMNIKVDKNAIPGTYPLTVYGDGVDGANNGAPLEENIDPSATLIIPKRYVEIDGPWGLPGAANYMKQGSSTTPVQNTRNVADGSISVDTLILRSGAVNDSNGLWYGMGSFAANTTNPDGGSGFKSNKFYTWAHSGSMGVNAGSSWYFTPSGSTTLQTINPEFSTPNYGTLSTALTASVSNQDSTFKTSSTYTINWHKKFESSGLPTVGPLVPDALIDCSCNPSTDVAGGSVVVTRLNKPQNNFIKWFNTAGGFAAVAGAMTDDPYLEMFAAEVGLINVWFPDSNSGTFPRPDTPSDWTSAVTQTKSAYTSNPQNQVIYLIDQPAKIFAPGVDPNASSTHAQFNFTVKFQSFYRITTYIGDHFEADGYKGQSSVPIKVGIPNTTGAPGGGGIYVLYYTYKQPTL